MMDEKISGSDTNEETPCDRCKHFLKKIHNTLANFAEIVIQANLNLMKKEKVIKWLNTQKLLNYMSIAKR